MNGAQHTLFAQYNAKMTKFCVTLAEIQEVATIQINAYQKEWILMAICVLGIAQFLVTNHNNCSATEEYYQMDATRATFALIELWTIMENYVQEFVHPSVNQEKLFSQH